MIITIIIVKIAKLMNVGVKELYTKCTKFIFFNCFLFPYFIVIVPHDKWNANGMHQLGDCYFDCRRIVVVLVGVG